MAEPTQKYRVLKSLRHNGKPYGPGVKDADSVELTASQAKRLVDKGVVEAPKAAKADKADKAPGGNAAAQA